MDEQQCFPVTTVRTLLCTTYVRKLTDNFAQTRYARPTVMYIYSPYVKVNGHERMVNDEACAVSRSCIKATWSKKFRLLLNEMR